MNNNIIINIDDVHVKGHKLCEFLDATPYYNMFLTMMQNLNDDPTYDYTKSDYFIHCTKSTNFHHILINKASIISLSTEFSCNTNTATTIYGLYNDFEFSLSDKLKQVKDDIKASMSTIINNYMILLGKIKTEQYNGKLIAHIDEYGRIMILEGLHRLILFKISNIDKVPILIIHRDDKWKQIINFFEEESIKLYKTPMLLYEKIYHPDFDNFKVIRDNRIEYIYHALTKYDVKTGLDLGCFIGHYSHYLAKKGIKMYGVEYEKKYYDMACILNKTYNVGVTFFNDNIYSYIETNEMHFDFIIMLSVAYHLYRDNKHNTTRLLKQLPNITNLIVLDDEPTTNIFSETDIRTIYDGYKITKIYTDSNKRNIYIITIN